MAPCGNDIELQCCQVAALLTYLTWAAFKLYKCLQPKSAGFEIQEILKTFPVLLKGEVLQLLKWNHQIDLATLIGHSELILWLRCLELWLQLIRQQIMNLKLQSLLLLTHHNWLAIKCKSFRSQTTNIILLLLWFVSI
jgi:hypothetical protein